MHACLPVCTARQSKALPAPFPGLELGARDRRQLRLAIGCGGSATLLFGVASSILLLSAPEQIIAAYTDDSAIHATATGLIRLAAFFILLDATQVTTSFCLRAFKDTRFPFLVLCGSYWFVTLPLGYGLGIVFADSPAAGTVGFWQALITGIGLSALILALRLVRTLRRPLPAPPSDGEPVA